MTNIVLAHAVGRVGHDNSAPKPISPTYRLHCVACTWEVDAPLNYHMARLIAWGHQSHVSAGPKHAVSFVPVQ